MLPLFSARGWRVSILKHAHHGFDIDRPGKDSYRHRQAGASEVLLASGARWVLMHERRAPGEPTLDELLRHFSPCDLVLVEGYKSEPIAKLEVYRPANGKPPLWPANPQIIAAAARHAGVAHSARPDRSGGDRRLHPAERATAGRQARGARLTGGSGTSETNFPGLCDVIF
jgi:molybdopterin-guanine dinucleotide biosynthesis protein B